MVLMNHPIRIPASQLAGLVARAKKSARTRARQTEARKPTGPVLTEAVSFTVDGKPKGKGRPRFTRHSSQPYTPASTVAYERLVKSAARLAMANRQPMDGPVSLSVRAVFPIPKSWTKAKRQAAFNGEIRPTVKPDADNSLKALMDGCNKTVWIDDVQVVEASISKQYGPKPYLHIIARPFSLSPRPDLGDTSHDDQAIARSVGCTPSRIDNQDPPLSEAS
jgi:Holliday junction resolvase RusA-like endonuclease